MTWSFDAVTLDVGGVFVVPRHDLLAEALASAGVEVDRAHFWDAHYHAMHGVDADQSPAETFDAYVPAFCHGLPLDDEPRARAIAALQPLFGPSGLWAEPIPESVAAIRKLHDAGIRIAVVSNADGTVERVLLEAAVCQLGEGPGVPVEAIVDSGAVGVAKPDPGIFRIALDALGTAPDRTLHVGDSVHYDVNGARAAGLQAVHFDPRRLCPSTDHGHLTSLLDLL